MCEQWLIQVWIIQCCPDGARGGCSTRVLVLCNDACTQMGRWKWSSCGSASLLPWPACFRYLSDVMVEPAMVRPGGPHHLWGEGKLSQIAEWGRKRNTHKGPLRCLLPNVLINEEDPSVIKVECLIFVPALHPVHPSELYWERVKNDTSRCYAIRRWALLRPESVMMTGCRGSHQPRSKDTGAPQEVIGTGNPFDVTTGSACKAARAVECRTLVLYWWLLFCQLHFTVSHYRSPL